MSPFETAFASARKAGKKAFTFNGKSYNTELAKAPAKASAPKARPTATTSTVGPKARPKTGAAVPPRADSPSYSTPTRTKADATAERRANAAVNKTAREEAGAARRAAKPTLKAERDAAGAARRASAADSRAKRYADRAKRRNAK